jgi:hypothetical protein
MLMGKRKISAIPFLLVTVVGGAGVVTYQKLGAQPLNPQEANALSAAAPATAEFDDERLPERVERAITKVTPEKNVTAMLTVAGVDPKMKSRLKGRFDAAKTEVEARGKEYVAGRGTLDVFIGASRRLLAAELDLSPKTTDHVTAWEAHRQRMQAVYEINLVRYNAGRINVQDLAQSDYYRLDAEIGLERAKAGLKKSGA